MLNKISESESESESLAIPVLKLLFPFCDIHSWIDCDFFGHCFSLNIRFYVGIITIGNGM